MRVTVIGSAPSEDRWEDVEVRMIAQIQPEYQYFNSQSKTWTNVGKLDLGRKAFMAGVLAAGAGFRKKTYSAKEFQIVLTSAELQHLQHLLESSQYNSCLMQSILKLKP